MPRISSNLEETKQRLRGLETIDFGREQGFYLVIVQVEDGDTSGHHSNKFEVMGRKFSEKNTGAGYNAYRITKDSFDTSPVRIDIADEGQWHLLKK